MPTFLPAHSSPNLRPNIRVPPFPGPENTRLRQIDLITYTNKTIILFLQINAVKNWNYSITNEHVKSVYMLKFKYS